MRYRAGARVRPADAAARLNLVGPLGEPTLPSFSPPRAAISGLRLPLSGFFSPGFHPPIHNQNSRDFGGVIFLENLHFFSCARFEQGRDFLCLLNPE